jgi:hypothetical protein
MSRRQADCASDDQKTRRRTTKISIQSQTPWNEKSRRPKSKWADGDGVNSASLVLEVRDWTHCAQEQSLTYKLIFVLQKMSQNN